MNTQKRLLLFGEYVDKVMVKAERSAKKNTVTMLSSVNKISLLFIMKEKKKKIRMLSSINFIFIMKKIGPTFAKKPMAYS